MIDIVASINSGQVFLWKKIDDTWYGTHGDDILKVHYTNHSDSNTDDNISTVEIESLSGIHYDLFRQRDDIKEIILEITRDKTVSDAVAMYPGLRILDQDPFQCLISFITSSNSSIQKIRSCLVNLVTKFGEPVEFDGREFWLFPEPAKIAALSELDIRECGFGYRSRFVLDAARHVADGSIDLIELRRLDYNTTRDLVCSIQGVGEKIADCLMLFALDKLEAFPLDRWMLRVLERDYNITCTKTITSKQYHSIHDTIVDRFGIHCGYVQQFLFKRERELAKRGWL